MSIKQGNKREYMRMKCMYVTQIRAMGRGLWIIQIQPMGYLEPNAAVYKKYIFLIM